MRKLLFQKKYLYLILVISLVTFYDPFYSWDARSTIVNGLAFFIGSLTMIYFLSKSKYTKTDSLIYASLFFIYFAWILIPFRQHAVFSAGHIFPVIIIIFILLSEKDKKYYLEVLIKFVAILSLSSLIIFILLLIGFDLPYYHLDQNFRTTPTQYFRVYPGTVVLSSQLYEMPWGGYLIRSSGLFPEPGHFGILCGVLLASKGFLLKTWREKLILVGGIISFSGAFFAILFGSLVGIWIVSIFEKKYQRKGILIQVIFVVITAALVIQFTPVDFQNRIIWDRIPTDESSLLEARSQHNFNIYYESFKSQPESLIGYGQNYDVITGGRSTDWRGRVALFGWLSLISLFCIYFFLILKFKGSRRIKIAIFITLIIIGLHRTGRISNPLIITIFVTTLTVSNYSKENHNNDLIQNE